MTSHISAKFGQIAKNVLMPGCPVRAKLFAEKYLESPKLVNTIRNMNMFTGTYKGKPLSICASGMGVPSMGIYSYELFKFYDVDRIIRVGTCGSFDKNVKNGDIFLVTESFSTMTDYLELLTNEKNNLAYPSPELTKKIEETAEKLGIPMHKGRCFSCSTYYQTKPLKYLMNMSKGRVIEMETYALFINARLLNKQAAAVLTVTDVLKEEDGQYEWDYVPCEQREHSINNGIEVALNVD